MSQFDRDTSHTALGNNRFNIEITDNWSINGIPNGGYLMAMLTKALLANRPATYTPIITANFLSRCAPGSARLEYELISSSRQFDRFEIGLYQNGKERIRALGTLGNRAADQPLVRYESPPVSLAARKDCVPAQTSPGYTFFNHVDLRMDPESAGWVENRLSGKSEIKGWIKLKDNRPFDLPALVLIADAFPPPVFASQGPVAWVPTLEISVSIRQMPATEWLKGSFQTRFITGGILEEDGQVWDASGNLIAISRQIAQYRSGI